MRNPDPAARAGHAAVSPRASSSTAGLALGLDRAGAAKSRGGGKKQRE
jgi:hypothetical protein